jgi:hypothetical protein
MRSHRVVLAVLVSALALAAPQAAVSAAGTQLTTSLVGTGTAEKFGGGGYFTINVAVWGSGGDWANWSGGSWPDLSAQGWWTTGSISSWELVRARCLSVEAGIALVGGVVVRATNPSVIGRERSLLVADWGNGLTAMDGFTFALGDVGSFCSARPSQFVGQPWAFNRLAHGNFSIHGG